MKTMSTYARKTRECSVNQLHPELRQVLRSYFQEHNLGDLETESLMCCETISEKNYPNKLISWVGETDLIIRTGMLLTSEQLIWARSGDRTGVVLNAANLKDIQVRVYKSMFNKETGLEMFGYIGASKGQVRGYIGMGEEDAAQKFFEVVQNAVKELQPPPTEKTGLARWLSPRE